MANFRRVARELALKTLFQVDVGKQPLAEVLDGALEQVRVTVDGPVAQSLHEAQSAVRAFTSDNGQALSSQSKRQLTQAGTQALTDVRALADRLAELTRAVVADAPQETGERADSEARAALAQCEGGLERVAARESPFPELVAEVVSISGKSARQMETLFRKHIPLAEQTGAFVVRLVHGALEKQAEIDARIASLSAGWSLDRQAAVDRNIMRLAAYEVLFVPDIPTGASINEAVELAKKYSTAESGRFVNGVLGALAGNPVRGAAVQDE